MSVKKIPESEVINFLAELTSLTEKYNIALSACDCCNGINLYTPKKVSEYSCNAFSNGGWNYVEYGDDK